MRHVHWSDDDRRFGPFTYAKERHRQFGAVITSGKAEDDDWQNGCYVRFHAFGHTLVIALPQIIRPAREWHEITTEPTRTQMIDSGRAPGYWEVWARQFGFLFTDVSTCVENNAKAADVLKAMLESASK